MGGFFSTFFINAPLLLGVLGAAVPFVLHMVYRRRAPRIEFSTLRFLRMATERTARRRRIKEWLLLLLRAAAIFLLAVGLAGPIFRTAETDGTSEASVALVLDNSFSMAAEWEGTSQYARARDYTVRILRDLSAESQAALVYAWPPAEKNSHTDSLTTDRNGLANAINRSEVSVVQGDLAAAVTRAEELLIDAPSDQREVYILTDLQKATWRPLAESKLERPPTYIIIDCGTGEKENLAVSDVGFVGSRPAAGVPLTLKARVKNFGGRGREVKAGIFVDRAKRAERTIKIGANAEAEVAFPVTFDSAGSHTGWVALEGVNDILPLDDRRYFAIDVPERLRVAVVREEQGAVALLDEAFFIIPALNPGAGIASPIAPEALLRSELTQKRLSQYRIVYLLNLPELTLDEVAVLTEYLDGGGSVVIFLGENTNPEAWNKLAKSDVASERALMPATLGTLMPRPGDSDAPITLDKIDFKHAIFSPFQRLSPSFFTSVVVKKSYDLKVDKTSGARTLAWLSDERPFMVQKFVGEGTGKVVLFCTTATTKWSNLPARRLYLPLLHQMTYYLARMEGGGEGVTPGKPVRFRGLYAAVARLAPGGTAAKPGAPAKDDEKKSDGDKKDEVEEISDIEVVDPRAVTKMAALEAREDGMRFPVFRDTARPGVYHWRYRKDETEHGAFVVNLNAEESDLTALPQEQMLAEMLNGRKVHFVRNADEAAEVASKLRQGVRLRTPLLFFVIGLLVAECLVANQGRARKPEEEVRVTGGGVSVS